MTSHRQRDLARYQRMQEKVRLSISPNFSYVETKTLTPKYPNVSPDGVVGTDEKQKQPSPNAIVDETRRRRYEKYRARTTRQSESARTRKEFTFNEMSSPYTLTTPTYKANARLSPSPLSQPYEATINKASINLSKTGAANRFPIDPPDDKINPLDNRYEECYARLMKEPIVGKASEEVSTHRTPSTCISSLSSGIPTTNYPDPPSIVLKAEKSHRKGSNKEHRDIVSKREPPGEIKTSPAVDQIEVATHRTPSRQTSSSRGIPTHYPGPPSIVLEAQTFHGKDSNKESRNDEVKREPPAERDSQPGIDRVECNRESPSPQSLYSRQRLEKPPLSFENGRGRSSPLGQSIDTPIAPLKDGGRLPIINTSEKQTTESDSWTKRFQSFRYKREMTRRNLEGRLRSYTSRDASITPTNRIRDSLEEENQQRSYTLRDASSTPTNRIRDSLEQENHQKGSVSLLNKSPRGRSSDNLRTPPTSFEQRDSSNDGTRFGLVGSDVQYKTDRRDSFEAKTRGVASDATPHMNQKQTIHSNVPFKRDQNQVFRIESPRSPSPCLDQGTVRLLYSQDFQELINCHQTKSGVEGVRRESNSNGVSFMVRKRPLFAPERLGGEFDVVNARSKPSNTLVVYQTKILPDRKTKELEALSFHYDSVFSEEHTSEEFYLRSGQELVIRAKNGGFGTFVIYGGPGSGKTHTMTDIEERAVYDIFESSSSTSPTRASVQYLELSGNQCFDLLGPIGSFVRIVDAESGSFRIKGSSVKSTSSADELLEIISNAKQRLATQATIRRRSEQESYLFCQITIDHGGRRGCLTLLEHSGPVGQKDNSFEQGYNDTSFDALLDCIHSKTAGRVSSIRSRKKYNVTKIMNEIFDSDNSGVCVIATVSPNATATEQTISTLSSLTKMMSGHSGSPQPNLYVSPNKGESSSDDQVLPRQWSHSELVCWMTKKRLLANPVPPEINGRFAMRMSKIQLKNTFYDVVDDAKAEKLYFALRAENDRIARIRVKRRIAQKLEKYV